MSTATARHLTYDEWGDPQTNGWFDNGTPADIDGDPGPERDQAPAPAVVSTNGHGPSLLARDAADAEALLDEMEAESGDPIAASINRRVERLDLHAILLEDDEPIEWIWGDDELGYIERGTVACFHGFGGLGKSMLTGALTRAVTEGTSLLDQPCKKGRVLIIDAENPRREIKRRVKRLALDADAVAYIRTNDQILAPGFAGWLEAEIRIHDADLLILDSQRALQTGDEKEQQQMRAFYTEVANVAEAADCAIVVVHHDNKAKEFSGSTDIDACVGWRWHLYADNRDDSKIFLKQAKTRGAPKLPTIQVVMNFTGMRLDVSIGDEKPPTSARPGGSHGTSTSGFKKAQPEEIAAWIRQRPSRQAQPAAIRKEFGIQSHQSLIDRRAALKALGIAYQDAGSLSVYYDASNDR